MSASAEKQIWPRRWWWLALTVIVVLAGTLRYTGYDFSLPYVDHPDEPNHTLAGQLILEEGTGKQIGFHAYPPAYPTLTYFLIRWFHNPAELPTTMIGPLRLLSITVSLITIILVALLADQIAGGIAGLLAALIVAVQPAVVTISRLAVPDPYLGFFTVASVLLTVLGTRHDRDRLTTGATIMLMLAIAFKYQGIFLAPVVLAAPLLRLRRLGVDRRRVWANFRWNLVYLSLFLFWLVAIFPALEANTIPNFSGSTNRVGFPIPRDLWANLRSAADLSASDIVLFGGLVGLAALPWLRYRDRIDSWSLCITAGATGLWWVCISIFGVVNLRQQLGMAMLLSVLVGAGLSGLVTTFDAGLERLQIVRFSRKGQWLGSVVVALAAVGFSIPALIGAVENAHEHSLPDRRNDLAMWADQTLEGGRYIGTVQFHKVFNPNWGGYTGETYFDYAEEGTLDTYPLDDLTARDIEYAIVLPLDAEIIGQTAEGQAILDSMTRLKLYPASADFRDPGIAVYWLHPIEDPLDGQLGPLRLVGVNLSATEAAPGDAITFRLFWQADSPTDIPYRIYNHLTALDSRQPLAQIDGPPLPSERRTTAEWSDPEETIMSRDFVLTVPTDLAPGEYRLLTGFYQTDNGQRLISPEGEDFLLAATIRVTE